MISWNEVFWKFLLIFKEFFNGKVQKVDSKEPELLFPLSDLVSLRLLFRLISPNLTKITFGSLCITNFYSIPIQINQVILGKK